MPNTDKSTRIPPDSFAARPKQAMVMRGLKQETLAEAAGASRNTIHKLTSSKAQSIRKLIGVAVVLGVSPVWLQTDEGAPTTRNAVSVIGGSPLVLEPLHLRDNDTPLGEDEVELPPYKEVGMSAGAGRTVMHEIEGRKLRPSYVTLRASGVDPSATIYAQFTGNNMEPLVTDGSITGVNAATTHITDGEIYALEHDGMLRVKLVYRLPGSDIRLRSFNHEKHPDEEYSPEDMRSRQISVIGWVFQWSTVRHRRAPFLVR